MHCLSRSLLLPSGPVKAIKQLVDLVADLPELVLDGTGGIAAKCSPFLFLLGHHLLTIDEKSQFQVPTDMDIAFDTRSSKIVSVVRHVKWVLQVSL